MEKRTIEQLNLLDDFLFQAVISRGEEVESDIYDLEMNKRLKRKSLPKRSRYYHALIDSKILDAGKDYRHLRRVVIIMILPYDPFGKNRMVYTVRNSCMENPSVPYDDGAEKIFLYTGGTTGTAGKHSGFPAGARNGSGGDSSGGSGREEPGTSAPVE